METLDRLRALLPEEAGRMLAEREKEVHEVRLRVGRPVQFRGQNGSWMSNDVIEAATLKRILASLMDHSFYTREEELSQGFFTMSDGCRVGVCGRLIYDGQRIRGMAGVGSFCIRVSREKRGCADGIIPYIMEETGDIRSALIVSGPGLGKTTLLREIARRLSGVGRNVCIADERHELAASREGVPTLDVGPFTDVMDGGPKALTIAHMLRAAAPEVIIADEIGGEGDAEALAEAARCGVSVIASAHAGTFEQLTQRRSLRDALEVFDVFILMGEKPGNVVEIREECHAAGAGVLRGGGLRVVR